MRTEQRDDIDPTLLSEAQLGMALRRAMAREGSTWTDDNELFYLKSATRKEIDFTGPMLGRTAVEAKYTETGSWRREAATVNASRYLGILATRNVLDVSSEDQAWAVPCGLLAYCIDT